MSSKKFTILFLSVNKCGSINIQFNARLIFVPKVNFVEDWKTAVKWG